MRVRYTTDAADAAKLAGQSGRSVHATARERKRRQPPPTRQRRVGTAPAADRLRRLFLAQVGLPLYQLLQKRDLIKFQLMFIPERRFRGFERHDVAVNSTQRDQEITT